MCKDIMKQGAHHRSTKTWYTSHKVNTLRTKGVVKAWTAGQSACGTVVLPLTTSVTVTENLIGWFFCGPVPNGGTIWGRGVYKTFAGFRGSMGTLLILCGCTIDAGNKPSPFRKMVGTSNNYPKRIRWTFSFEWPVERLEQLWELYALRARYLAYCWTEMEGTRYYRGYVVMNNKVTRESMIDRLPPGAEVHLAAMSHKDYLKVFKEQSNLRCRGDEDVWSTKKKKEKKLKELIIDDVFMHWDNKKDLKKEQKTTNPSDQWSEKNTPPPIRL